MAKHNPNYEYFPLTDRNGNPVQDRYGKEVLTLNVRLYAPDGSVFKMPHGGDPATYTAGKGYKAHPDADWLAKNEEYERAKAESLRISEAQRELRLRSQELKRRSEEKQMADEINAMEAELAKQEAALDGEAPEPESAPEEAPKPKAKAKAKPKAS